ncbi:hypothetical protein CL634_02805 [bacterium]|nr:hypothetical protein [bacterium]
MDKIQQGKDLYRNGVLMREGNLMRLAILRRLDEMREYELKYYSGEGYTEESINRVFNRSLAESVEKNQRRDDGNKLTS